MILALESSLPLATCALMNESGEVVAHDRMHDNSRQGADLIPFLKAFMEASSLKVGDLSGVALHVGPGSATGLRMGIATVQGILLVFPHLHCYAIGLEKIALGQLRIHNPSLQKLSLIGDAYAGDIFCQVYEKDSQQWLPAGDLHLRSKSEAFAEAGFLLEGMRCPKGYDESSLMQIGKLDACAVAQAVSLCTPTAIEKVDVNYMKSSSAEIQWDKKQQGIKV